MSPQAAAHIVSRLGFATDEDEAARIIAAAITLGATEIEGADALVLWRHLLRHEVVRVNTIQQKR